jgi:hypothetical protein
MNNKFSPILLFCTCLSLAASSLVGCKAENDQAKESIKKAHEAVSHADKQTQDTLNQAKKILDDSQREESE